MEEEDIKKLEDISKMTFYKNGVETALLSHDEFYNLSIKKEL